MIKDLVHKLKNLHIDVKNVHIRFEDDYFQSDNPYSFGILADSIVFDPIENSKFTSKSHNQKNHTVEKQLLVKNARVYWNSMSETFIPTSLWEQTKD